MEKIALAKKIDYKDIGSNEGIVTVEPLYPGYGNTVGNSLRRVLLSSLPGSAVVGVKIKGAKHEFMSLDGIKEDVVDIILNLKDLKLKILADIDEPIKLELNVQGKKKVTAKDISKDSQVEIINDDLVLANITDSAGSLSMEIYVDNGRGYLLADKNNKKKPDIDYIDIDSIFSPIVAVSYKVENVRVGKMTNWHKLIFNIKTDGSISVKEAFEQSSEILIEQFNALIEKKKEEPVVEKKESKSKKKVLKTETKKKK
jgi:DNA-directed RNA polymerase subunit alpha